LPLIKILENLKVLPLLILPKQLQPPELLNTVEMKSMEEKSKLIYNYQEITTEVVDLEKEEEKELNGERNEKIILVENIYLIIKYIIF